MQAFEYANPVTVKEAVALLGSSWADAAVLAGGTDLISLMKDYIESPKRVVNIKGIKELGGISRKGGNMRIGATVTLDELASNAAIRSSFPALTQAALGVTSPQLRNMGTVAGDLCQRPRCWYYRRGVGLLAKGPNGEALVPNGENKFHAIFASGHWQADIEHAALDGLLGRPVDGLILLGGQTPDAVLLGYAEEGSLGVDLTQFEVNEPVGVST